MTDVLQRNPIQELVDIKNEVPEKFRYANGYHGDQVETLPWLDVPSIDLGRLFDSSSPDAQRVELSKLQQTITQGCCFQVLLILLLIVRSY